MAPSLILAGQSVGARIRPTHAEVIVVHIGAGRASTTRNAICGSMRVNSGGDWPEFPPRVCPAPVCTAVELAVLKYSAWSPFLRSGASDVKERGGGPGLSVGIFSARSLPCA